LPAAAAKSPLDLSSFAKPAGDKSIAVLPFINLSEDKDANAFFADGMHDELLTALAKIGALKVISRTSVLAYREPAKRNLRQIAAELGVASILEGSVSRSGKSVRIIVQLIDAATDEHRWSDTYNLKEVTDVFQVQADIAARIASSLAATISPGQKLALAHKLTSSPTAYDLYLRARAWHEPALLDPKNRREWETLVIRPLEQAVALDPSFAAAYAELGQVHGWMYFRPYLDGTPARLAKARDAIDNALRLEPRLPEAHLALAITTSTASVITPGRRRNMLSRWRPGPVTPKSFLPWRPRNGVRAAGSKRRQISSERSASIRAGRALGSFGSRPFSPSVFTDRRNRRRIGIWPSLQRARSGSATRPWPGSLGTEIARKCRPCSPRTRARTPIHVPRNSGWRLTMADMPTPYAFTTRRRRNSAAAGGMAEFEIPRAISSIALPPRRLANRKRRAPAPWRASRIRKMGPRIDTAWSRGSRCCTLTRASPTRRGDSPIGLWK
jgi:TolB-like protein